jgi:DNA modification methylase
MTRTGVRQNGGGNRLYFGDNLTVLREHVKDESVDLIYLDPPFNSDANYNVLFRSPTGQESDAQVEAFRDSWEWADSARDAYADVIEANGDVALVVSSLKKWLGENAMMAYIVMMAARLIELRRVLKPTGSLYLHCDPTASHYLKLVLDAVFGHSSFQNEIIWKRTGAHGSAKRWAPVHDTLLFYSGSDNFQWNRVFQPYEPNYLAEKYRQIDKRGRFQDVSATGAGTRKGNSGEPWQLHDPTKKGRHWAVPDAAGEGIPKFAEMSPQEKLSALDAKGQLYWPKARSGGDSFPRIKQRPGEGNPVQDCVFDIAALNSQARERLGYPTQKPVALLDRIILASSKPGDVVLDPFCGCGTSLESAQKNGRNWIGIDIAHYAMTLIEGRLKAKYPTVDYSVHGRPTDLAGARDLARRDKYQFQWWAAWKLGSQTYREDKKGADRGIDGNIYFHNGPYGAGRIIASVKGGENVGVQMVRDLRGVIEREDAEMGVMVTLANPTGPMLSEAASAGFVRKSAHGRLPRLQIASVADILAGHMPKLPPLPQPDRKQSTARKRVHGDQIEMMLPFAGDILRPAEGVHVDPRFRLFG